MAEAQWYESLWAKVSGPVKAALRTGLAPREAALALALGLWLGLFPLYFGTTLFCVAAAWRLRLNHGVIQVGNFAATPFQLLFIYPFFKAGSLLFGGKPFGLPAPALRAQLQHNPGHALRRLSGAAVHASLVWLILGLVLVPLLWWAFARAFHRLSPSSQGQDGGLA